ncbi:MAG TPA: FeS-binding protein [Persephonella sp.]|uniref:Ferredoxin n=1 Tax=Persephonella marina (strain DSM 14350 / EX-H1) TaxID=123214 RepID=C0QTK2_PERMH|nr:MULTISPECIES: NIL domain-containing protein [Persephonella]ACO04661.1 ferredoxin [Persephonella marina EX-H1]HCB70366.1 FeS-binding protein [Persephonella sp.]
MESIKLKLIYPEEKIKEPILSRVCKNFDVEINIRKANVQENIGWLELELTGKEEEIEKAIQYLVSQGIDVSPLEGQVFME